MLSAVLCLRSSYTLEKNWKFIKGEQEGAYQEKYDDSKWETVRVPHDWAIYGPFDEKNNERVTIRQTDDATGKTTLGSGVEGGLPWIGIGWYRTTFKATYGKMTTLIFDGAMSDARVWVNGYEVGYWPYGYNSFHFDVSKYVHADGSDNVLAVRLQNLPESTRWYPGAGIYRNVHVLTTESICVPVWGTQITTPIVEKEYASVKILTKLLNADGKHIRMYTRIYNNAGQEVASLDTNRLKMPDTPYEQNFLLENPELWSPETPNVYKAFSQIFVDGQQVDEYNSTFGVRKIEYIPLKGFFLNGVNRKFKGVCNHHDLGPLGAAVHEKGLIHQLNMLKDMGCDSIRTSHNMPTPELVRLCDEMGFMMMIESFDEWDQPKVKNGYHRIFDEWAEKDLVNSIHHFRNHPSVIMWSIGNEIPTQCAVYGYKVLKFLQDICHREDPTRLVTLGINGIPCALDNYFASYIDIIGVNYHWNWYDDIQKRLPQKFVLGSETTSTVSARGVYKYPVKWGAMIKYDDKQSSSYDLEICTWSNVPDEDFILMEDRNFTIGHFVWTGFDYLGEPTPYYEHDWPSHSSYFGIIDLASIPKDRYYLYRSQWRQEVETLHVLPHWTWPDRVGQVTPIYVYTNYPSAEVFINGVSQGVVKKSKDGDHCDRYRLRWPNVVYQPGEVKVVAYDYDGNVKMTKIVKTAGEPHHIELHTPYKEIKADEKDLSYVYASIVDKDGNLCPTANNYLQFKVTGAGNFKAVANGDSTCTELFHRPQMHAFNGMLTVLVQSTDKPGDITLEVYGEGLEAGQITIKSV